MLERLGWIQLISKKNSQSTLQLNLHKKRIWLHALSVGEVKSALPLVNALKNRYLSNSNYELVITASTKTGFDVAHDLFLEPLEKNNQSDSHVMSVQVGYFPFDFYFSVKSICSRVDPDIVIIVESDLWPEFLWYMERKTIPVFLVNARLSQSSFEGYKRFSRIFAPLFCLFEKIMVQTEIDKDRFVKIGVSEERVLVTGNIKFDQKTPQIDNCDQKTEIFGDLKNKRYILAGSTHEGEEAILISIFEKLRQNQQFKDIGLIIAPRDPKRASDINKMFIKRFNSRLLTDKKRELSEIDIVVVDKMGVLASLYSICDIAFVGGSLVPCGGHNPLEPAIFAKPVVFGPYTDDFKEITDTMLLKDAAFMVKNRDNLFNILTKLLHDRDLANRLGENGYKLVIDGKGAVDNILSVILRNF